MAYNAGILQSRNPISNSSHLFSIRTTKEPALLSISLLFLHHKIQAMTINQQHITLLRQLVEESADHPISTSNDFIFLSGEIQGRLKEALSVSTLKRLWGYVDGYTTVRVTTLDILARFVGFPDWETFVSDYCEVESVQSSHRVLNPSFYANELNPYD